MTRDETAAEGAHPLADERVRFASDKNVGGMPRELKRHKSGRPPQQPALWTSPPHADLPPGVWGAYPKRFLQWAIPLLRCAPGEVLHLCSGALGPGVGRARIDLRREARPDIVADATRLPFRDATFRGVMIDPPYSVEYARDLYQTRYPRPSALLAEASRVLEPTGRVGILHFFVPMPPPGCKLVAVRGITTGCGYRIRAFSVFEREQDGLFDPARGRSGDGFKTAGTGPKSPESQG